jgi:transcriptional regulator with XRE-family HTH domain
MKMDLGKAIKTCRVSRGYGQIELADMIDKTVGYISLLERGKRDMKFSTLEDICLALKVPVPVMIYLATDKSEMPELPDELHEKLSRLALDLIARS